MQPISIIHIPPSGTTQHTLHAWIAHIDNLCVGHIHLQREANKRIKFLDAWVHKNYRRQGIYRKLWDTRWAYVTEHFKNFTVYAWCKPMFLPLLVEKGFKTSETCVYVEKEIAK